MWWQAWNREVFTRVIHDPPVISLAGDLYSTDFYRELLRVMRNQARLFHYIGDPQSKSGRNTTGGGDTQVGTGRFHENNPCTQGVWCSGY